MEYRWIENIEEFKCIKEKWDSSLLSMNEDNPFLLSSFVVAWWKYYSTGLKLRIFIIIDDEGEIIGGLPLCQNGSGKLEYIGGINANYTECLFRENLDIIWGMLLKALASRRDWHLLQLKRYRKDKFRISSSDISGLAKFNKILFDVYPDGYSYLIRIPQDFSNFYNCILKKLRYYLKRSINGFSKLGNISLYSLRSDDKIDEAIANFIELSRLSFKKRNRESAFNDMRYCAFFKDIITTFHRLGYSDINILKIDDRAIAIHVGFSVGGNLNYIFTTYDMDFAYINPGHLLIYKLVELASKRKNVFLDMYTGYQFYKEQWSNYKEEIFLVEIRPNTTRSRINRIVMNTARTFLFTDKTKQLIRSSPVLVKLCKYFKSGLHNF